MTDVSYRATERGVYVGNRQTEASRPLPIPGSMYYSTTLNTPESASGMSQTVIVFVFLSLGLVVSILGIVAVVKNLTGGTASAKFGTIELNIPASAFILLVGLSAVGGAAYLNGKSPTTVTPDSNSTPPITAASRPASHPAASFPPSCLAGCSSSAPVTTPPPSSARVPSATMTYPKPNAVVSKQIGFTAGGTVSALGPDSVWLTDYDGGYTVDQKAAIIGNAWAATDQPLGDSAERLPFRLTVIAVLATPGCATALGRVAATEADYITTLPIGCAPFATVTVNVAKP